MKKKLVRAVAFITVISIGAASLMACGRKEESSDKITIKWAGGEGVASDSEVEKYLEEKYNVNIEVISIASSYYEKLGAMIAGGNIPDVMFMNELESWQPLAKQGVFAEIDKKLVEEAAPEYVKLIDELNPKIWNICKLDNDMYTIPRYTGKEDAGAVVWRKDWLDKLGITKVPETIDEFEEAFRKIAKGDPDGNGKADTYGMTGWGNFAIGLFDEIFGAYGVMPEQWNLIDGKIVNGDVADGSKQALERLHKWYTEGLIDPEFITETVNGEVEKFESGRLATYVTGVSNYSENTVVGREWLEKWKKIDPNAEFAFGPLPTGANGESGGYLWGPRTNFVAFGSQVEDEPEKMKIIIKMLSDMILDEETALMVKKKKKGVTYDYNDPEIGASSGIKYIGEYTNGDARAEYGIGTVTFFSMLKPLSNFAVDEIADKYTNPDYIKQRDSLVKYGSYQDAIMRSTLPSSSEYKGTLDTLRLTAHCEFITGQRSLNDWDKYVSEWMSAGGEQLTKEAQEYYDTVINVD